MLNYQQCVYVYAFSSQKLNVSGRMFILALFSFRHVEFVPKVFRTFQFHFIHARIWKPRIKITFYELPSSATRFIKSFASFLTEMGHQTCVATSCQSSVRLNTALSCNIVMLFLCIAQWLCVLAVIVL